MARDFLHKDIVGKNRKNDGSYQEYGDYAVMKPPDNDYIARLREIIRGHERDIQRAYAGMGTMPGGQPANARDITEFDEHRRQAIARSQAAIAKIKQQIELAKKHL